MNGRRIPCLIFLCFFCDSWIFSTTLTLVESFSSLSSSSPSSSSSSSHDRKRTQAGKVTNSRIEHLLSGSKSSMSDLSSSSMATIINNRRDFLGQKISWMATATGVVASIASTPPSLAASTDSSIVATGGVKVSKRAGGLAQKIRGGVCFKMDELQRDLMQERWDLLDPYPAQLRSYVQLFTTYTDAAFPSDLPSDYGLRVALRYEVGRFFAAVERFKRAVAKQALDEAYTAYADMSLHLDRYLRVGGLYTYYDSVIDNEQFFREYNDALVYSDPVKDPAEVRDLIVLCKGPDKGKTGIVIGLYPDGTNDCVVKLDRYRGMREIRVVPRSWAAKRLGEQDPDDVFLIPRNNKSKNGGNIRT